MMEITPSLKEFLEFARKGNVIPVCAERLADLETPVSAFLKLDDGRYSYLLESVEGQEKIARFSFIASRPRLLFTAFGQRLQITEAPGTAQARVTTIVGQDPLVEIERRLASYQAVPVPGLPRFYGGLVGYLSYDMVHHLERLPRHRVDDLLVPELLLMLTETVVVFDHMNQKLLLIVNAMTQGREPRRVYEDALRTLQRVARRLKAPVPSHRAKRRHRDAAPSPVRSNLTKSRFVRMVKQAKQYIRAGDIIQVVLSQRFERPLQSEPFTVYRCLRSLNPSPYMYFLRCGAMSLVGASPEMLVRCDGGHLETRPIAGTRPRGRDDREDATFAQQLLTSPKERAEHLMLVDLGRNDLGRVAQVGSVRTPELMVMEQYSHVLHLVSGVTARLRSGCTAVDVLRATFPAGTVSGAPKVRAMEIIAELEREARGPYAGAIGYFSFSGNMDTCLTIRTVLIKNGRAYVQAGAGIVADSNPEREYQETVNKAKACLRALEIAEQWDSRS